MTTIKGTAPMTLTLEFTGTEEELLVMVEEMVGPLDSRDRGDAMGAIIYETIASHDSELVATSQRKDGTFVELRATVEYDSFSWEGV